MSATPQTKICRIGGHTDHIRYEDLWVGHIRADSQMRVPFTALRDLVWWKPQHVVYCTLHDSEDYISIEAANAGVLLGDLPLLQHPSFHAALARRAEALAPLQLIACPGGYESVWRGSDGRVRLGKVPVPRGRYQLDFGDGIPNILIAP